MSANPNPRSRAPALMADPDPASLSPLAAPTLSSPLKENAQLVGERIAELNQSQTDIMAKLQRLREDMQNWRSRLDNQMKTYKDELQEMKETLNADLDKLRSGFKELRSTLQKQQEDITTSLRNLGLEGTPKNAEDSGKEKVDDNLEKEVPSAQSTVEVQS